MNSLLYLQSRRLWTVPQVTVWGTSGETRLRYLTVEAIDGTDRILAGNIAVGASYQDIFFSDLYDHRGNRLPETIRTPRVIIRPRSPYQVYLVGEESDNGFLIARESDAPGPIIVDLLILETGD